MTSPDISREAVEGLAREHDLVRFTLGMKAHQHDETAATLRALRAALDAAEQRAVEAAVLATENEGAFKVWRRRAQEAEAQLATARAAIHKEGQSDAG